MKQEPTEESTINHHLIGHCSFGPVDLDKHKCPGMYQRWYMGVIKKGRKKVDGIVYLDEYVKCSCYCHIPPEERPKPKKRRAAKKTTSKTRRKK